ncbi:hybrid sensor histidine kinase/response regulator [Scytonema hofmannii PCC 7110]|uniref:histidine kinase n=1 Tax=Scytonema hofmannii PCC 7110 TaxID=128403 RepID=A0A139X894_9CYAN|nr:response regulator [Scytonema hofmannii]KYC40875.1 hybrid sensor histidine kinase/response regulator [Scytonema hofmannii PCC 7110]
MTKDKDSTDKGAILIVDDTPTNLEILFDLLSNSGFTVLIAEDGESAIERAEYAPPDLILLDILMPGMDGFETCRRLKANSSTKDIPIIFMTALSEALDKVKGLSLGAVDYITKPLMHEEVLARIELHLRLRNLTKTLQQQNLRLEEEISERKQAEQKIHEQAALLDITTDAILVRGLNNEIHYWNKGAEQLYGWTAVEVIGKNANELLYQIETLPQLQEIKKKLTESGTWQGELNQVHKKGQRLIVASRWTLIRDKDGQPKSILIVNTDITEKKQLESQLLRAQRLESIGTLAGGIAHDLNNIFTPILASAQLLQMKLPHLDERNLQVLKIIENNTRRGAALVKQVLQFARGVEGKRTIVQIGSLFLEIEQIVRETFPKSIEFYTSVKPDLWAVFGDATHLHQVLMNLIVNARDAMPDGGILSFTAENQFIDEHYARIHLEASVGPYVAIAVTDTGIGMSSEIADRIFEPFFTTKEFGKGTGLGLSTVRGIIKSHSGFVTVDSKIGEGTEFKVFLPAVAVTATPLVEDLELPKGNGELILVVDDEINILETTKISLEAYNYKVLTAGNGIDAIALYAQHKHEINLVLVDMMMPLMDGAVTIRTIQKLNSNAVIVAVSGLSGDKLAGTTGVKAFISKPYLAEELLQTLHSVLCHKSSLSISYKNSYDRSP